MPILLAKGGNRKEAVSEIESPREEIKQKERFLRIKAKYKGGGKLVLFGFLLFGAGGLAAKVLPGGFWSDTTSHFIAPDVTGFLAAIMMSLGLSFLWVSLRRKRNLSVEKRKAERLSDRIETACRTVGYRPLSLRHKKNVCRPGLTFGYDVETGRELFVPDDRLKRHTLVLGGTGTGKSSFLNALAFQQMLRGGGLIMVDAKRDTEAIRRFAWMATIAGRMIDFRLIDLGDVRSGGHKYNPLGMQGDSEELAANLANRIFQAMPPVDAGSDAQHYRELIYDSLIDMVSIILATRKTFTVEDIQYLFKYPEEAFLVIEDDLKAVNDYDALQRLYRYCRSHWGEKRQKLSKWQSDMSTLSGALGRLMADEFKEALSVSASGEINLEESFLKRHILYFALPWMTKTESCQGLMRMLLSHLQQVIGGLAEQKGGGTGNGMPFMIILDEFGSYAQPGFAEVVRMGRSAGAALFLVVQTLSRLSDSAIGLNENFARDILNNCRSLVSFSIQDHQDAEKITSRWGERIKGMQTISVSTSEGESEEKAGVKKMANPRQTTSQGMSEGIREMKEFVISPSVLTQWLRWVRDGKGRAVVECDPRGARIADTVWADVVPPTDFTVSRVLPKLPPRGAAQPLALVGRVNQLLSPTTSITTNSVADSETTTVNPSNESRDKKTGKKEKKKTSSDSSKTRVDTRTSKKKPSEIVVGEPSPSTSGKTRGKTFDDDPLAALAYLAGLSGWFSRKGCR